MQSVTETIEEIVLPMEDSFLITWPGYNVVLSSVIHRENAYDWFMNSFVQMRGTYPDTKNSYPVMVFLPVENTDDSGSVWSICPFIELYIYPKAMLALKYRSFADFLMDSIKSGFYVSVEVDQFFRKERKGKPGFSHKSYIYGYDLNNKLFYMADHFNNRKYEFAQVSMSDMERAYYLANTMVHALPDRIELNRVYLFRTKDYPFRFDLGILADFLKDYLNSKCSFGNLYQIEDNTVKHSYGLDNYKLVSDYLQRFLLDDSPLLDSRVFAFIKDHKHMMMRRMEYLEQKTNVILEERIMAAVNEVYQKADMILSLSIKYNISHDAQILHKIRTKLTEMESLERNYIPLLIDCIESAIV